MNVWKILQGYFSVPPGAILSSTQSFLSAKSVALNAEKAGVETVVLWDGLHGIYIIARTNELTRPRLPGFGLIGIGYWNPRLKVGWKAETENGELGETELKIGPLSKQEKETLRLYKSQINELARQYKVPRPKIVPSKLPSKYAGAFTIGRLGIRREPIIFADVKKLSSMPKWRTIVNARHEFFHYLQSLRLGSQLFRGVIEIPSVKSRIERHTYHAEMVS